MQYSFVDDAERFRESQDIAYRRWEADIEAAINAAPATLAKTKGWELSDWLYGHQDNTGAAALDLLLEAVAKLGASMGNAVSDRQTGVLSAARQLADAMIAMKQAEVSK